MDMVLAIPCNMETVKIFLRNQPTTGKPGPGSHGPWNKIEINLNFSKCIRWSQSGFQATLVFVANDDFCMWIHFSCLRNSVHFLCFHVSQNSERPINDFRLVILLVFMWYTRPGFLRPNPLLMYSANVKDRENANRWLADLSSSIVH